MKLQTCHLHNLVEWMIFLSQTMLSDTKLDDEDTARQQWSLYSTVLRRRCLQYGSISPSRNQWPKFHSGHPFHISPIHAPGGHFFSPGKSNDCSSRPWTSRTESVWEEGMEKCRLCSISPALSTFLLHYWSLEGLLTFFRAIKEYTQQGPLPAYILSLQTSWVLFCILKDSYTWSKYSK